MAASYSHLESDNEEINCVVCNHMLKRYTLFCCSVNCSQQTQPMESRKGKEPLRQCTVKDFNPSRSSAAVSIYRVPDILMLDRVKREAYVPTRVSLGPYHVPTRVSLGPYHYETEELRSMDSHKESALQRKLRSMDSHKESALQRKLRSMDSHKEKAKERMTIRFNNIKHLRNDPNNMDFFPAAKEEIRNLEEKIRDNYEEKIDCYGETLAEKLTLDGCFILEILSTLSANTLPEDGNCYEPLFEENKILCTGMDILYDMLKLENQIPFIVLLKLLKLQCSSTDSDAEKKLFEMMREKFLPVFYPFQSKKGEEHRWSWPQPHHPQVDHLLGWLRRFIISPYGDDMPRIPGQDEESGEHAQNDYMSIPGQDEESAKDNAKEGSEGRICNRDKDSRTYDHIHPAIELENAGIKLERCKVERCKVERCKGGKGGIANIKFDESKNTIYLPRITIRDSTEILFRNLIAFEMCKPSEGNDVACYVCLMDQLIDSEKDVALLRKRKIITNHLGSDAEVAQLFNGLCKGVTVDLEPAFHGLTKKVHNKYNNKFRVQLAELVREYFSSPWKTLGLLGGIALLLLSIVQTIVAILALYK